MLDLGKKIMRRLVIALSLVSGEFFQISVYNCIQRKVQKIT